MCFHICSPVCVDGTSHSHIFSRWQSTGNFSYTQPHLCSHSHIHTQSQSNTQPAVCLWPVVISVIYDVTDRKACCCSESSIKNNTISKPFRRVIWKKTDRRKINGNSCLLQARWNSKRVPYRYKAYFKNMKNPVFSMQQQQLAPNPMNLWNHYHVLFRTLRGKDGELFDMSALEWNI